MKTLSLLMASLIAVLIMLTGCGSSPSAPPVAVVPDELDEAIRDASDYLNDSIPAGNMIVILNVQSDSSELSEYIIDELVANAVNDRNFDVVDRQQLDLIREEQNFQWAGEVDDNKALEVGRFFGAQTIVSGRVSQIGSRYRLTIRALEVQTARVQGQYNQNIAAGATITELMRIGGSGGTAQSASARPVASQAAQPAASTSTASAAQSAPASSQPAAPIEQPASQAATQNAPPAADITAPGGSQAVSVTPSNTSTPPSSQTVAVQSTSQDQSRPGLYASSEYKGSMDLMDAIDWIKLNARNGASYTIVLGKDDIGSNISLSFNGMRVNITLKGAGTERKVQYDITNPPYSLFTIGSGVTFTLEDNIALVGLQSESKPMVKVAGGTFIMNGGSIRDNTVASSGGGGVLIESGAFTMNNGTISGNTMRFPYGGGGGGGVYLTDGTFTMNNGTISGNSAKYATGFGGGVNVNKGSFTMNNGTISGNSADKSGGGVYVNEGVFIKSGSGGIIYGSNAPLDQANKAINGYGHAVYCSGPRKRDTTARVSQAMDNRQNGAAGGWE